jgi:hypothetical protein
MHLFAAAARLRMSALSADRAEPVRAVEVMERAGIVRRDRWSEIYVPGVTADR